MVELKSRKHVVYEPMTTEKLRVCAMCRQEKPETDYNKKRKGLQSYCRPCTAERSKQYYQDNQEKHKAKVSENRKKRKDVIREWLAEYLAKHPCVDCGSTDIRVLEFDHVRRDKSFSISTALREAYSVEKVADEVSKCDVRCANCHNIVTHERAQNWRYKAHSASKDI